MSVRGILDTSVFIARESGRPLSAFPEDVTELAVSIVTVAELRVGVLLADASQLEGRLSTYEQVVSGFEPLPVDAAVAERFATLVAARRRQGRAVRVNDTWIAATALAHDACVLTQDEDFEDLGGVDVRKL
jgi:predicted nucleic acid-binding protein